MNKYHERNIRAYNQKAAAYDNTLDGKLTKRFKDLLVDVILANDSAVQPAFDTNMADAVDATIRVETCSVSVLDVGCGNGTFLAKLSEQKNVRGFGVDLSPQMIANAKSLHPSFVFAVSGCEAIPFDDNSMDIITVCAAYHHFPDVDKFASEAKRLLRAGGHIYIADIGLPALIKPFVNLLMPLSKGGDVRVYSHKEISSTFSSAGFRFVTVVKKGHIQVVVLAKT